MTARKGFGSKFSILVGSAQAEIGDILGITGPSYSKDTIDTTHMGTADEFRTFLGGLRDAGSITLDVQVDLADADASKHLELLGALEDDDTPRAMTCQLGTTAIFSFSGLVTEFSTEAPLDDKQTASITIKISGKPTIADVTS